MCRDHVWRLVQVEFLFCCVLIFAHMNKFFWLSAEAGSLIKSAVAKDSLLCFVCRRDSDVDVVIFG